MQFTKDLEGSTILATPTGNNARRSGGNGPIEFDVVKVKRKYVDLCRTGSRMVESYDPESGATQQAINAGYGNNAGYIFFKNAEEYRDWEYRKTIIGNIIKMSRDFSFGKNLENLSKENLAALEHILLKVCD